jgi:DNA-binding beta-propeller fold protein YncE
VDGSGNVIVADAENDRIRKITPQGQVSTLAGSGEQGHQDGEGIVAQFNWCSGVAMDGGGNVIVADNFNHRIRMITSQGQVSTLAGTGEEDHRDGEGNVAQFNSPYGIAVDGGGNVIVADADNHRIRKITPQGQVSTLAGSGEQGHQDGEGTVAQFNWCSGVAMDGGGNVIVADKLNHRIRMITSQGQVSTLAGTGEKGHRDGEGTFARFNSPNGIAVDGGGNVIVADTDNHRIRMITPQGQVSTLAGTGEESHRKGHRLFSTFGCPSGVAVEYNKVCVLDVIVLLCKLPLLLLLPG